MTDLEAMKLALEALEINLPIAYAKNGRGERFPCFSDDPLREIKTREAITALRQALEQPECNPHPDAPHGFNRESSHSLGRYVCDCEGWEPEEQEPVGEIVNAFGDLTAVSIPEMPPVGTKLYTSPPRREWVGLNYVEVRLLTVFDGLYHVETLVLDNFIRAIEAKLKEKNRG